MDSGQMVKDVPIAMCTTIAVDEDTGQEVLLVAHEMLYFGKKMKRSLLNPNQLRYAGVKVRDDPTREHEKGFGIKVKDVQMEGTVVYFKTQHPTKDEIEDPDIPNYVITREEPWDPRNV